MVFRNIITSLLLIFFASCNSQNPSVKNVKPAAFEQGISKEGAQLVDVRTPEEYKEKHLQNSKHININDGSFEKQMNQLDKSKPLYLYCMAGNRSNRAGEWAVKNGFKEVYNLDGGITAWMNENGPVVTASGAAPTRGMSFDDYLNHLKASPKLVIVDFNAVWCGPCKILKPIVQRQVNKHRDKVELLEIDIDKNRTVASTMRISGVPVLMMYKGGKEVWRHLGLIDENTLGEKINEFIK